MAPPPNPSNSSSKELGKRIVSAAVLAPPVLAAIYFGPPYSDLLVVLAAGLMAWEWARISGAGKFDAALCVAVGAVILSLFSGILGYYRIAVWVLLVGSMGVAVLWPRSRGQKPAWPAFGVLYVGLACLAFQWLRVQSLELVLFLLFIVWATDIAAFFVGRRVGGPKLAPGISPKKTWSGLGGGIAGAATTGGVAAFVFGWNPVGFAIAGGFLAVVAQGGDLLESQLKRRYGVKDASRIIPGHGGVLDRADGVMAASLVMGAALWISLSEGGLGKF
jgi:phosphatidate cytidylyltransferase